MYWPIFQIRKLRLEQVKSVILNLAVPQDHMRAC